MSWAPLVGGAFAYMIGCRMRKEVSALTAIPMRACWPVRSTRSGAGSYPTAGRLHEPTQDETKLGRKAVGTRKRPKPKSVSSVSYTLQDEWVSSTHPHPHPKDLRTSARNTPTVQIESHWPQSFSELGPHVLLANGLAITVATLYR